MACCSVAWVYSQEPNLQDMSDSVPHKSRYGDGVRDKRRIRDKLRFQRIGISSTLLVPTLRRC